MTRARRHQRLSAALALGLLALAAELTGRSLVNRIDLGRHIEAPSYSDSGYYPILLVAVKLAVALLLARLLWRFLRAHLAERAARRLLAGMGKDTSPRPPRLRLSLSLRLWAVCFSVTATFFLVQSDVQRFSRGRWPLLAPWLHSSALPVFAVLSVLMAIAWRAVRGWLAEYERFAAQAVAQARRVLYPLPAPRAQAASRRAPRTLFGLAFESRPPPLPA
jgi:hypothetical protein